MPSHLFQSLSLRGITFRNRIVISPMCQYSAIDGLANDWHLVHLGKFAQGGAGSVMVEATAGMATDWGSLPAAIRQGAALLAAHLYDTGAGGGAPPAAVTALWRPFRVLRLGNERRRA